MRITASGITKTMDGLNAKVARIKSLKPATEAGAQEVIKLVSDSFRNGRSPAGVPFAPLALSTIKGRRNRESVSGALDGFSKILDDKGRLKGSITAVGTDKTIKFGTNVEYAGIHQFGSKKEFGGKKRTPARPFLPVEKSAGGYSLMRGGPVDKSVARILKYIATYIRTGRVR